MPKVKFVVEHRLLEANSGQKLREIALDAGISVDREMFRGLNCRGLGLCGSCKVWIHPADEKTVNSPNLRERIHGMRGGRRLACQTRVMGDLEVTTMPGGDDRLAPQRDIAPPPTPVNDPGATRKPDDEASSIAHPLGHPSAVGKGELAGKSAPTHTPTSANKKASPAADTKAAPADKATEPAENKASPADKAAEPADRKASPGETTAETPAGKPGGTSDAQPAAVIVKAAQSGDGACADASGAAKPGDDKGAGGATEPR